MHFMNFFGKPDRNIEGKEIWVPIHCIFYVSVKFCFENTLNLKNVNLQYICLFLLISVRLNRPKNPHFWEDVSSELQDDDFRRYYRMNKATFLSLTQFLNPARRTYRGGREQIEKSKSVAMTLCYLGTRLPYKLLAGFFGVSEEAFIRSTDYIMEILERKVKLVIKWPSKDEYEQVANDFNKKKKKAFPNVVGALDGCHIKIAPKKSELNAYHNFKRFHSIHLQAVCVSDRKFTDIFVG